MEWNPCCWLIFLLNPFHGHLCPEVGVLAVFTGSVGGEETRFLLVTRIEWRERSSRSWCVLAVFRPPCSATGMVSSTLELPLPLGKGFPVGEIVGISRKPLTKWSCDIKLRGDGLI